MRACARSVPLHTRHISSRVSPLAHAHACRVCDYRLPPATGSACLPTRLPHVLRHRLLHTLLYALRSSPWRSIAFGVGAQTTLIMCGRLAATLLPSVGTTVQVVVNAPIALQWTVGLIALSAVREQRHRYDAVAQVQGIRSVQGTQGADDEA